MNKGVGVFSISTQFREILLTSFSQKQMPKIDFSKKGENTYFKTHNRLFFGYFFNRRPIWEPLLKMAQFLQTESLGLSTLGSIISEIFPSILKILLPILLQIA